MDDIVANPLQFILMLCLPILALAQRLFWLVFRTDWVRCQARTTGRMTIRGKQKMVYEFTVDGVTYSGITADTQSGSIGIIYSPSDPQRHQIDYTGNMNLACLVSLLVLTLFALTKFNII